MAKVEQGKTAYAAFCREAWGDERASAMWAKMDDHMKKGWVAVEQALGFTPPDLPDAEEEPQRPASSAEASDAADLPRS